MLFCSANIALLINFLALLNDKGFSWTITSSPQQLYLAERDRGTVRCQNRSADGEIYFSSISNAIWYRHYSNDTNTPMGDSGPVYSSRHTLNFDPLLHEDQGHYFCCVPNNGPCSTITTVAISVPPSLRAVDSNVTVEVGSQIILGCSIISLGIPIAQITWMKTGQKITGDHVAINNTFAALTLTNIVSSNGGTFTCSASNGVQSRNIHIELTVLENPETNKTSSYRNQSNDSDINYNEDRSRVVQLLVTFFEPSCQTLKNNLSLVLSHFVQARYSQNVTVILDKIKCIERLKAIFKLQLSGPLAYDILQQLLYDINSSTVEINIGYGVLNICEMNCTDTTEQNTVNKNEEKKILIPIIMALAAVVIISLLILLFICCQVLIYMRCVKNKKNSAMINTPQHKCANMPKNNEASSHYNTLQFHHHDQTPLPLRNQPVNNDHGDYVEPNPFIPDHADNIIIPRATSANSHLYESIGNATMQTIQLPSSITHNYQPNIKIVPSLTHKDYVDVVK